MYSELYWFSPYCCSITAVNQTGNERFRAELTRMVSKIRGEKNRRQFTSQKPGRKDGNDLCGKEKWPGRRKNRVEQKFKREDGEQKRPNGLKKMKAADFEDQRPTPGGSINTPLIAQDTIAQFMSVVHLVSQPPSCSTQAHFPHSGNVSPIPLRPLRNAGPLTPFLPSAAVFSRGSQSDPVGP